MVLARMSGDLAGNIQTQLASASFCIALSLISRVLMSISVFCSSVVNSRWLVRNMVVKRFKIQLAEERRGARSKFACLPRLFGRITK